MVFFRRTILAAATVLSIVQIGSTAPTTPGEIVETIIKRAIVRFEDCGDANDPTSKVRKAGRAFADAATLARWTFDRQLDDGTKFQDTKAYSHYFQARESAIVKEMFNQIHLNNDPHSQYKFIVSCKDTDACGQGSLAVTDANPATDTFTPTIRLCPKFFDRNTPQTKNDLNSKDFKRDPKRRDNSWCQPNQPFSFFETAGHTVLHEMTHLDKLGELAGISPRPIPSISELSHGTDDIYVVDTGYDPTSPERSARRLKINWENHDSGKSKKKPKLERWENAESYAAAATEFYFQQGCGWDEIME